MKKTKPKQKRNQQIIRNTRGQAYILEGIVSLLLISAAIFAIVPAIGIAPFTEAPEDNEREAEIEREVTGILDASASDGSLKETILAWDSTQEEFTDDNETEAVEEGQWIEYPDTNFGDRLNEFSSEQNASANVELTPVYHSESVEEIEPIERPESTTMIQTGTPSVNTITVSTTITLQNNDRLKSPAKAHSHTTSPPDKKTGDGDRLEDANHPVEEATSDIESDTIYNTVEVEIVIWYDI